MVGLTSKRHKNTGQISIGSIRSRALECRYGGVHCRGAPLEGVPMLFPTTLVGSYPQPEWLIDRANLAGRFPPRVRMQALWRVPAQFLDQAQDDATILAIRAQEEAGIDIISDGEIRRESYSNRFATALEGVDLENPDWDGRSDRARYPDFP